MISLDALDLVIMRMPAWLADGYFVGNEAKVYFGEAAAEIMGADSVHVDGHPVDVSVSKRCEG